MKIITISDPNPIKRALQVLRCGGVVAHPTDTVWGLAADSLNPKAVAKIHMIKQSNLTKPLLQIIPTKRYLSIVATMQNKFKPLIQKFWPGPLTLVLPAKSPRFCLKQRGGSPSSPSPKEGKASSIGLRYPDHKLSLQLARGLGRPLVSTSANLTGQPTPCSMAEIVQVFTRKKNQPDLILDFGKTGGNRPSTIIDLTQPVPRLLRVGAVSVVKIQKLLGHLSR